MWDKPKDPDLCTVAITATVKGEAEPFLREEEAEFKLQEGYLCPAIAVAVREMKQGEAVTLQVNTFYAAVVVGQSPAPHHIVWSSCVVRIGASHHTESPLPGKTERSAGWCARDG